VDAKELDITGMLDAWSKGDQRALSDVIPLVYDDLRLIARKHLGRQKALTVQSGMPKRYSEECRS